MAAIMVVVLVVAVEPVPLFIGPVEILEGDIPMVLVKVKNLVDMWVVVMIVLL